MDYANTINYTNTIPSSGYNGFSPLLSFIIFVLIVVGMWKVFEKAGRAGWKSIIPIYNTIVLLGIIEKPWWWILLMLIPFVNIVIYVIVMLQTAKYYGKSGLFGIGLIFFPYVFFLVLGFGSAKYIKATQPVQTSAAQ